MLTDTQWAMLEPLVEQCRPKGKTPPQDHDPIQVPLVSDSRNSSTDLMGKALTELHCPLPYRLMADQDTSAASISSTIRRLSGKRKYNQTAWLITSAGKRWRA
jgi:hypothetical protein